MILYLDDFKKYPNATYDFSTRNKSFVEYAAKLRNRGIQNCAFCLTVLNPAVIGLDPYSPDLTVEQKELIAVEATTNYWYFLREVARLPATSGVDPDPVQCTRGIISMAWLFFNSIDQLNIQPRQTGKSVGADLLHEWLKDMACRGTKSILLTKDNVTRVSNLERLEKIRNLLPTYLIPTSKKDKNTQEVASNFTLGNIISTHVSQSSEAGAIGLGRGLTSPIFFIDEVPFISHIGITIPAALAAGGAARDSAREKGNYNGVVMTTTAGKIDDRDGSYVYEEFVKNAAVWDEILFDMPDNDALRAHVTKNSRGFNNCRVYSCYSHTQLGKSDDWLLRKLAETNSKGEAADRDYFNRWTSGSIRSPLSVKLNSTITESIVAPEFISIHKNGYSIGWHVSEGLLERILTERETIISLDTSEAVGNDDIGLVISDITDLGTIGSAAINETNLTAFGGFIADLLIKYPKMTLMFERKSTGLAIMDTIASILTAHGIDPFRRVFNNIVQKRDQFPEAYREITSTINGIATYDKYRKHFGYYTDTAGRKMLYHTVLQENAKQAGSRVRSQQLAGQITSLVIKNGRIDHAASGHDDMVIAWLLTGWMLSYGNELDFYGIEPTKALSRTVEVKVVTAEDELLAIRTERARKEVEELKEAIMSSNNEAVTLALEARLSRAIEKANKLIDTPISFAAFKEELRKKQEMQRMAEMRKKRMLRRVAGG